MGDYTKSNRGNKGTQVVTRKLVLLGNLGKTLLSKFVSLHKRVSVAVFHQFTLLKNELKLYLVPTACGY